MQFTKHLREGVRRGRIRCSVRIWMRPHVTVGGLYRMDDGHIVVDSITPIASEDITYDLARESGFATVEDLLAIAKHGKGTNVYLIRFHYLPPGGWEAPHARADSTPHQLTMPARFRSSSGRRRDRDSSGGTGRSKPR